MGELVVMGADCVGQEEVGCCEAAGGEGEGSGYMWGGVRSFHYEI